MPIGGEGRKAFDRKGTRRTRREWVSAIKVGTMVKRAAKKKTARKKSAKKGPVNVPEIREQVRHLIAEQFEPMVTANTEEGTKGHLSQLK